MGSDGFDLVERCSARLLCPMHVLCGSTFLTLTCAPSLFHVRLLQDAVPDLILKHTRKEVVVQSTEVAHYVSSKAHDGNRYLKNSHAKAVIEWINKKAGMAAMDKCKAHNCPGGFKNCPEVAAAIFTFGISELIKAATNAPKICTKQCAHFPCISIDPPSRTIACACTRMPFRGGGQGEGRSAFTPGIPEPDVIASLTQVPRRARSVHHA